MNGNHLSELYKIRFTQDQLPRKNAIWKVICQEFLQKFIPSNACVIDIACGYGEFINNISAGRKIAIDMNPDACRFLEADIEFHQCSALDINADLTSSADIVFTSNFLEHLPNKQTLDLFLQQVKTVLKPSGKYIILGPNLRYLPGLYWDFYDHHLGLTHLSLVEALRLQGFEVDYCIPKFLPYTTQGGLPTHPLLVYFYLKIPIAWKLLGQQFFIIASKPSNVTSL